MHQKNQMGKAGRKLWELIGNGFANTEKLRGKAQKKEKLAHGKTDE